MNANKLSIITILVLFSGSVKIAYSQENFQPASVFTLNGDTLHGFIDYRNWDKNPNSISFRQSNVSSATNFNPINISGFSVLNELYISAIVKAESSPYQLNELSYYAAIKTRTDTVFLRCMFQGTKNLFYYNDKNGKPQFYLKQWPDFELLVYKKYLRYNKEAPGVSSEPVNAIKENKNFMGQLSLYLRECPSIQPKINTSEYTQSSLYNIFKTYYKCSRDEIKYEFVKDKLKLNFGIIAGISLTKLKFAGPDNQMDNFTESELFKNTDFENPNSINFSGGLYMDIVMARNLGKWSIYNELLLSSYSNSMQYEEYTHENNYSVFDSQLGYTYLKLNTMLRYKHTFGNDISVFINAGLFNGYMLLETNSVREDQMFWGTHTISEVPVMETSKYGIGYLAGIGSGFKKYSIEARLERNLIYSDDLDPIGIYFLLGYKF